MKLSDILKKHKLINDFVLVEEKDFSTFGLAGGNIGENFCTFIDNEEYVDVISNNVTMVITTEKLRHKITKKNVGFCLVENPRVLYFRIHNALAGDEEYTQKKYKTYIGKNCNIAKSVVIAKNNVSIGNNVTIEDFVVVRENTTIGDNCIIKSGVSLGGSDFEFKRDEEQIFSVNHYGGLIIGKEVEIQYNTGINKALYPWDNTLIGDYTKIDMLVHIAHGVKIGKACMIIANSGIGGRVTIGSKCWIGFAATIKNGINIGNNARVNMGSVVTKDVSENQSVTGNFAIEHSKFIENMKKETQRDNNDAD